MENTDKNLNFSVGKFLRGPCGTRLYGMWKDKLCFFFRPVEKCGILSVEHLIFTVFHSREPVEKHKKSRKKRYFQNFDDCYLFKQGFSTIYKSFFKSFYTDFSAIPYLDLPCVSRDFGVFHSFRSHYCYYYDIICFLLLSTRFAGAREGGSRSNNRSPFAYRLYFPHTKE